MKRLGGSAWLVAVCSLGVAPGVRGQTPANDDFANAEAISGALPITLSASNVAATMQENEPTHDGQETNASVWWSWVAPSTASYSLDTVGSDFDTVLAVYDVGLGEVASDDQGGVQNTSALTLDATSGSTYYFVVAAWSTSDPGDIFLTLAEVGPPTNDAFSAAEVLDGALPLTARESSLDLATTEGAEPGGVFGPPNRGTVWWNWTPGTAVDVVIEVVAPFSQLRVEVFTGSQLGSLALVPGAASFNGTVNFAAQGGETYRIRVTGSSFFPERLLLLTLRAFVPPANDNWVNAVPLSSSVPFSFSGSLIDATSELSEPGAFQDIRTTWWKWTAPHAQPVQLTSFVDPETSFFTEVGVGVFEGGSVGALTTVAGEGDSRFAFFQAEAGVEYFFRAYGAPWYPPADAFTILVEPGPAAPANDDFADAASLPAQPSPPAMGTLLGASRESNEPIFIQFGLHNVWYRWTAPETGRRSLVLDQEGSGFMEALAFTGDDLSNLQQVPGSFVGNQSK